ncbi:Hypothetical protein AA314_03013 [Archangium gephyra]|uniref:Uncharacterized protein n=1 Tax=Archangium gephyra TaxID=48 RepID=A0AAC8Q5V2_9BACT|nr:Hypothetical protein AA314_03013 [Archangium gephyra]
MRTRAAQPTRIPLSGRGVRCHRVGLPSLSCCAGAERPGCRAFPLHDATMTESWEGLGQPPPPPA